VAVVFSETAGDLERHAASELCSYLEKLYRVRVAPSSRPGDAATIFFLCTMQDDVPEVFSTAPLPDLSPQRILIRPLKWRCHDLAQNAAQISRNALPSGFQGNVCDGAATQTSQPCYNHPDLTPCVTRRAC
jgi:hypothetical protein